MCYSLQVKSFTQPYSCSRVLRVHSRDSRPVHGYMHAYIYTYTTNPDWLSIYCELANL